MGPRTVDVATGNRTKIAWCLTAPLLAAGWAELLVASLEVAPPPPPQISVWNAVQDREMAESRLPYRYHDGWLWEPISGALIDGEPINSDGYRGPPVPIERTPALRIVVLGESATFGFGVPDRESWARRLEATLRQGGAEVEVLNLATTGYTIVQGLELYRGRARRYRPDVVIACFGGLNERTPSPIGDRQKIELLASSGFAFRRVAERSAAFRWLARARGAPLAEQHTLERPRVSLAEYRQAVRDLARELAHDRVRLLLIRPGYRADGIAREHDVADYSRALLDVAREDSLALLDAAALFGGGADAIVPDAWMLDAWHPTSPGHARIAAAVAERIRESGWLGRREPETR